MNFASVSRMISALLKFTLITALIVGCAGQQKKQEISKLDLPLSAKPTPVAKQKRLDYLKKLIGEKNNDLTELEKLTDGQQKSPEQELRAEILINEVLLLEAYQYGIEEGLDLGEIEVP